MIPTCSPLALLAITALSVPATVFPASFDLSKPPPADFAEGMDATVRGLGSFRQGLADSLIAAWEPASSRSPGSCGRPGYARWVELYKWVDLLASSEESVTKRWLSRHISAERDDTGSKGGVRLAVHGPGTPVVIRHDDFQHAAVERLAGDPAMLAKVMDALVSKPYKPSNGPLSSRLDPDFVRETCGDARFLRIWCDHFSPDDFAPRVLADLQAIWKSDPRDFREFSDLALAIALVRDQPAPQFWPHHQVATADFPRADQSARELFSEIVSAFRRGSLRRDPRMLGVRNLMFVVDAPLDPAEIEWVRNDRRASGTEPPAALASVGYDGARMLARSYVWPWGPYRLASIRKRGGICVDQAYYAAILAKSAGIPSMMFCGLGKDGGHAWVGYLRRGESWDFGTGRTSGQGLVTGETLDPGNWTPNSDHDMEVTVSARSDPSREAGGRDLVIAGIFRRAGDASGEGMAINSALFRDPRRAGNWDAREDWLVRTGAPSSDLKAYHREAARNLSFSRDFKARHQEALARLEASGRDASGAERIERGILEENRVGRSDLSAAAAGRLVKFRMDEGDPEAALREYRREVLLLGKSGGSDFFYRVTRPLGGFLISKGRPDLARRVIKEAYDAVKPSKGSLLEHDFHDLWKQAGGVQ